MGTRELVLAISRLYDVFLFVHSIQLYLIVSTSTLQVLYYSLSNRANQVKVLFINNKMYIISSSPLQFIKWG